jgi:hypothetical protein
MAAPINVCVNDTKMFDDFSQPIGRKVVFLAMG